MSGELRLGARTIGAGRPVFVVAELSANHLGRLDRARRIVEAAAAAGADAIKLQTYRPETMTLPIAAPPFVIGGDGPWAGRTLFDLYEEAQTPWEWHRELRDLAADLGLVFFSTPFDETAVELLEELEVPVYKVASFELVDLPLLARVAATGKPVILSTGMAGAGEIEEALDTLRRHGAGDVALLKCTSAYPAPPEEMNLRSIPALAERFGTAVGLSDHTLGWTVPVAAVALGASIVEKHLTLARADGGPDAAFSLEPDELRAMVEALRTVDRALGSPRFGPTRAETASLPFRRSLFTVRPVAAGEELTAENVRPIRPGNGLAPRHLREVLGRRAARDLPAGTPLSWDLVGVSSGPPAPPR
ncbi:MAG TPA: pseudaminic acid synthase [Thermoanaerobaculia bacterium]|nr:pseudaminic acid synthase [Thermoanaerobaculia bacterium]